MRYITTSEIYAITNTTDSTQGYALETVENAILGVEEWVDRITNTTFSTSGLVPETRRYRCKSIEGRGMVDYFIKSGATVALHPSGISIEGDDDFYTEPFNKESANIVISPSITLYSLIDITGVFAYSTTAPEVIKQLCRSLVIKLLKRYDTGFATIEIGAGDFVSSIESILSPYENSIISQFIAVPNL